MLEARNVLTPLTEVVDGIRNYAVQHWKR